MTVTENRKPYELSPLILHQTTINVTMIGNKPRGEEHGPQVGSNTVTSISYIIHDIAFAQSNKTTA
jgi:hypothetical protein